MKENGALSTRIRQELSDLERVVDRVDLLIDKVRQTGDDTYLDGAALNLHGFYSGVERIFEQIAREMEGKVPSGPDWHRELLLQVSGEIAGVRPKAITAETRHCLDKYRRFRHVVRNVYTFHLELDRVQELGKQLRACYEAVVSELRAFADFLEHLDQTDDVEDG